jgi:hypothetical protein
MQEVGKENQKTVVRRRDNDRLSRKDYTNNNIEINREIPES